MTTIARKPKVVRIIQSYYAKIDILGIGNVSLFFPYYLWLSSYCGQKIGIRAAYVLFQVEGTYDVLSCDIKPSVDLCDVKGAPVHQNEEIPNEDTHTPTTIWELAFGSDDHSDETNLNNAIAENFSPEGQEELQRFQW